MLFGAVPVTAPAQTIEENTEYAVAFIDDVIWLPEGEESIAAVAETGEWVIDIRPLQYKG